MLNRHEIAGAEGEAINLRWEAEMQQASEELRDQSYAWVWLEPTGGLVGRRLPRRVLHQRRSPGQDRQW